MNDRNQSMNKVIIKDDGDFKELVRELSDERRALGIEEPQTDFEAAIRKWKESRERAKREKTHRFLSEYRTAKLTGETTETEEKFIELLEEENESK